MKIRYYPETDTLYLELNDVPSVGSEELLEGVVVDYGEDGEIVGVEVERISQRKELILPFDICICS